MPGPACSHPSRCTRPCPDDATYNRIPTALQPPEERANAILKHYPRAQRHISLAPSTITNITATALVIITLHTGTWQDDLNATI